MNKVRDTWKIGLLAALFLLLVYVVKNRESWLSHKFWPPQTTHRHEASVRKLPFVKIARSIKPLGLWSSRELRPNQTFMEKKTPFDPTEEPMNWYGITGLAWSPDGKHLVVGTSKGMALFGHAFYHDDLEVWSVAAHQLLYKMETHRASSHAQGEDLNGGRGDQVFSPTWSSSGGAVAASAPGSVSLWGISDKHPHTTVRDEQWTKTFANNTASVACVTRQCFSRGGKSLHVLYALRSWSSKDKNFVSRWVLAQYDAVTGSKKSERILNVREVQPPNSDTEFASDMTQPAISNQGNTVAFIAEKGVTEPATLFIHSTEIHHRIVLPFSPSSSTQLSLSADGSTLALKTAPNTLSLRDTRTGKQLRFIRTHDLWNYALAPDGKQVAVINAKFDLSVWDAHTGLCLKTIPNATKPIVLQSLDGGTSIQLQFSPDSTTLAVARQDGTVALWRVR